MIVRTTNYALRDILGGCCPYTDEICDDWVCEVCPIEKENIHWRCNIEKQEPTQEAKTEDEE